MRRKMLEQYPTFFHEVVRRPALIMGESGQTGHDIGLDPQAKLAPFPPIPERFVANDWMASQIAEQASFWANLDTA